MPPPYPPHIETRKTATAGFGLFTSEEIPAGQLIFAVERPLIVELDSARLTDTCGWCLKNVQDGAGEAVNLKACTGCKVLRYCSKVGVWTSRFSSRSSVVAIFLVLTFIAFMCTKLSMVVFRRDPDFHHLNGRLVLSYVLPTVN